MAKIVKLKCPECKATLEVNLMRGEIERSWPKGKSPVAPDLMAKAAEAAEKASRDADVGGLLQKLEDHEKRTDDLLGDALKKAKDAPPEKPPSEDNYA